MHLGFVKTFVKPCCSGFETLANGDADGRWAIAAQKRGKRPIVMISSDKPGQTAFYPCRFISPEFFPVWRQGILQVADFMQCPDQVDLLVHAIDILQQMGCGCGDRILSFGHGLIFEFFQFGINTHHFPWLANTASIDKDASVRHFMQLFSIIQVQPIADCAIPRPLLTLKRRFLDSPPRPIQQQLRQPGRQPQTRLAQLLPMDRQAPHRQA